MTWCVLQVATVGQAVALANLMAKGEAGLLALMVADPANPRVLVFEP